MRAIRQAALAAGLLLAGCGDPNRHQQQATQAEIDEIRSSRSMVSAVGGGRAEQAPPVEPSASPLSMAPAPAASTPPEAAAPATDWVGDWAGAPALCGTGAWRVAGVAAEGGGQSACEIRSAAAGAPGTVTFKLACSAPGMTPNERWSLRRISPDRMELGRDTDGRRSRETLGRCA